MERAIRDQVLEVIRGSRDKDLRDITIILISGNVHVSYQQADDKEKTDKE
jgi:hypothetical protein